MVSVSVLSISSEEGPVSVSVFPNMDEKPNQTGLPSTIHIGLVLQLMGGGAVTTVTAARVFDEWRVGAIGMLKIERHKTKKKTCLSSFVDSLLAGVKL